MSAMKLHAPIPQFSLVRILNTLLDHFCEKSNNNLTNRNGNWTQTGGCGTIPSSKAFFLFPLSLPLRTPTSLYKKSFLAHFSFALSLGWKAVEKNIQEWKLVFAQKSGKRNYLIFFKSIAIYVKGENFVIGINEAKNVSINA